MQLWLERSHLQFWITDSLYMKYTKKSTLSYDLMSCFCSILPSTALEENEKEPRILSRCPLPLFAMVFFSFILTKDNHFESLSSKLGA